MRARILIIPLLLSQLGCASYHWNYSDYTKPDRSIVLGDLPPPSRVREGRGGIEGGAVNVDYIDGKVVTTDLNPFAHPTRQIMLSPGLHHLGIQMVFFETQFTARMDLRAEANHIYRLTS